MLRTFQTGEVEVGALVITPFKRDDDGYTNLGLISIAAAQQFAFASFASSEILVSRGWVPEAKVDPATRARGQVDLAPPPLASLLTLTSFFQQIEGKVTIEGLIRHSEKV